MEMEADRERIIEEIKTQYSEERCTEIQQLLSTMANPIRFRILCTLRVRSFSVTEIVAITDSNLSNVSQHLKMMWFAGYITRERHGKRVTYALADERVAQAIDLLENMYPLSTNSNDGCV